MLYLAITVWLIVMLSIFLYIITVLFPKRSCNHKIRFSLTLLLAEHGFLRPDNKTYDRLTLKELDVMLGAVISHGVLRQTT